ncbi:MAG: biotin--[acetyl-CoA-carboxylase] ligase [Trueperaceae bacterium]
MPILTDAPDDARPLLPAGTEWRAAGASGLPSELAAAWAALGSERPAWWAPDGTERIVVVVHEAPRSQFDALAERLADGRFVPAGVVCVACTGSRFHGQRGRPWAALRGNLHVSVHLPLDVDAAPAQAGLAALPAVAIARAIERATAGRVAPRLKWVNDVLVDGRKIAGVLVATQLQGGRVRHAVVGVGANVARAPELAPSARAARPTSLADVDPVGFGARAPHAWTALLPPLLDELERGRVRLQAGDGAALVDAYRERAAFLGRTVTVWPVEEDAPGPLARGRVEALLPDLALRLEGRVEPIRTGRMTIDPADEPAPSG